MKQDEIVNLVVSLAVTLAGGFVVSYAVTCIIIRALGHF